MIGTCWVRHPRDSWAFVVVKYVGKDHRGDRLYSCLMLWDDMEQEGRVEEHPEDYILEHHRRLE